MKNTLPILLFIILFSPNIETNAQWDVSLSQYMMNQLHINPAYTGIKNTIATHLNVRNQWSGIEGAPTTYILGIDFPINKTYSALGFLASVDESGPLQTINTSFSYSYLLKLHDRLHLSLGLSGGAYTQSLNLTSIDLVTSADPLFQENINGQLNANVGVGAYLSAPSYFVGFSLPHIFSTELISYDYTEYLTYKRNLYINGGYVFDLDKEKYIFKPMALFKINEDNESSIDFSLQMILNSKLLVGAAYRLNNEMAFIGGIQLSKNMLFSYSLDLNNTSSINACSHEISLVLESYKFYKKNRQRRFKRKKKKDDDYEEGMKSMRYF